MGASTSSVATKPTAACGAGVTFFPLPVFVEVGAMGPQANRSFLSGYVSADANIPLAKASVRYRPVAMLGYSRLFETGHALDYGLAFVVPRPRKDGTLGGIRVELRDYYTFANPSQHNIMLRG